MRHSYEITGEAVVTNVGDPIRELLEGIPRKVDVEIRREMGKMPRKMKNKVLMIVLSVVVTLVLYYIFTNFLVVVLPKGRWFNIAF